MLVYANQIQLHGIHSEEILFDSIARWLNEQLDIQFDHQKLQSSGIYKGQRGNLPSNLRIHSCYEGEPALCSWVLTHGDRKVRSREWAVEIGVKKLNGVLEVSCVVENSDKSAWVSEPVSASQPRLIRYILNSVASARGDVSVTRAMPGQDLKPIGRDTDSYRAFKYEIFRTQRKAAIVLVSPTKEGEYLVEPSELQKTLIGLADVVKVLPDSDTHEMEHILGKQYSAWDGAVNVLPIPSGQDKVWSKLFRSETIKEWGNNRERISKILAWVTTSTNIPRQRAHISPGEVQILSMRRNNSIRLSKAAQMHESDLRRTVDEMLGEREDLFEDLVAEKEKLEDQLGEKVSELWEKESTIDALKYRLSQKSNPGEIDIDLIWKFIENRRQEKLKPIDCLKIIECLYGDKCIILDSARQSADKMEKFTKIGTLLKLLRKPVTEYRTGLINGGDSRARRVFSPKVFAAKESEPVMKNKDLCRLRTFTYKGEAVEMFRHLKIGTANDPTKTIRIHFDWDPTIEKIVIGYCGEHLKVFGQ